MMVKNRIQLAILLVLTVLSASVWGLWDPDADPNLKFNLNFENNTDYNTIDTAVYQLVGDIELCSEKTTPPWEPEPNAMFNISGDFRNPRDVNTGDVNSCRISVEPNLIVWNLGNDANDLRTFGLWFGKHDGSGTFIGQTNINEGYEDKFWWQFRLRDGRIALQIKYLGENALHMRSAKNLNELGIVNDEWNHVAAVIDRRTRYGSKLYLNGAPIEIDKDSHNHNYGPAYVDPSEDSPVYVGGGEDDYDGLLDEIRLYHRGLNDLEISLLYQWSPGGVGPYALLPFPNHEQISTKTNLGWEPMTGAISQTLYFGTDPNFADPCIVFSGLSSTADSNTNADINGPLKFGTDYYWQIITNDINEGPVWKFTTEPGYATNPSPEDGARGVPIAPVDLSWTGSPDKNNFDVYFSEVQSWVENNDVNALVAIDITDSNFVVFDDVNLPVKGKKYYWRVITNFGSTDIAGPVWDFRAQSNEIVVNTADVNETHNEVGYPALTMTFLDANGNPTSVINGSLGTDNVAIFNLSDVNISDDYEIVVIPLFDKDKEADMNAASVRITSRPMAMHVTGNFIFNGRMDISGEAIPAIPDENYSPKGRCGGYRGPINAGGETSPREAGCYDEFIDPCDRFGEYNERSVFLPSAKGIYQFGPGAGGNGPYCVGAGGGHGGYGGDCSRGYMWGVFLGGASYSDEEVPVPFGGSAGGFGKKTTSPGGAGGGGVEIVTTGNIILGPNAEILAEGGRSAENKTPGGGGAGGSVRIIAGGSFINAGKISVNGGAGGNSNEKPSKCSGGGAGGRIAIFYVSDYNNIGQITANGGPAGFSTGEDYGETYGEPGDNGTIYTSSGSPKKASAPIPRDKDDIYYVSGGSGTIDLKWYSGYGGTTDEVFWGTTSNPTTSLGTAAATRGQHSVASPTVSAGNTYYWKVTTDSSVDSDVWSFTVVDWYCDIQSKPEWDAFYDIDCIVTFEDFAYFAQFWMDRDNMSLEEGETEGIDIFMSEWMVIKGRTP